MKRTILEKRVKSAKSETADALLTILNALNAGQRKKIAKDEKVAALLERYGIEYYES